MAKGSKIKVGDEFVLNCGTVVHVIEYKDCRHVVVMCAGGNVKSAESGNLRRGSVSWIFDENGKEIHARRAKSPICVGDVFELFCGISVTVSEYLNSYAVTVVDSVGNSRTVYGSALRKGEVAWRFGVIKEDVVGKKFTLNCGVIVEVVSEHLNGSLKVRDEQGNSKTVGKYQLSTGAVSWREFGVSSGYAKSGWKIKVGDCTTLNCGVDVTVDRYEGYDSITISDKYGNSRIVSSSDLKTGSVSWLRFGVRSKSRQVDEFPIGSVWQSSKHGEFTIVGGEYDKEMVVEWSTSGLMQDRCSFKAIRSGTLKDNSRLLEWDYLTPTAGKSYVYFVTSNDILVYIGSGKGSRYTHTKSGCSHNKHLNKLFFSGEEMTVKLFKDNLSKEEALSIERAQIKLLRPAYNTTHNNDLT